MSDCVRKTRYTLTDKNVTATAYRLPVYNKTQDQCESLCLSDLSCDIWIHTSTPDTLITNNLNVCQLQKITKRDITSDFLEHENNYHPAPYDDFAMGKDGQMNVNKIKPKDLDITDFKNKTVGIVGCDKMRNTFSAVWWVLVGITLLLLAWYFLDVCRQRK